MRSIMFTVAVFWFYLQSLLCKMTGLNKYHFRDCLNQNFREATIATQQIFSALFNFKNALEGMSFNNILYSFI